MTGWPLPCEPRRNTCSALPKEALLNRTMSMLRVGAVVLVGTLTLGACGGDDDDTSSSSSSSGDMELISDGKLVVCSDIPYAPFEFEDDAGELVGIDIELVKAMGDDLGLEVEFKDTDFDGIFAALKAKQCDMIASSVSITDERKAENEFTEGYYDIRQSMLVRAADASTLVDAASVNGKKVGVQSETTGAAYAADTLEGAEIKEFTGADEMVTALKANQVDAVVQDLPINGYAATKSDGALVLSAEFDSDPESYGFVVAKGNTGLVDALDGALAALRSNGKYDAIVKAYVGDLPS